MILSCYASGYRRNYRNDEEEIRATEYRSQHTTFDPENPQHNWWPTSIDFEEVAGRYGGTKRSAISPVQFFRRISSQQNLSEVRLFTHGAQGEIQFGRGGRLTAADVSGLSDQSSHFSANGRIVFIACNTGRTSGSQTAVGEGLLQAIANQIRVEVRGFRTGVRYRLWYDDRRRITKRDFYHERLPVPQIVCRPR